MEIGQVPIVSKGPMNNEVCRCWQGHRQHRSGSLVPKQKLVEVYVTGIRAPSIFLIYKRVLSGRS